MSLVFSAIAPHPPLLIPTVGKQLIKKLDKTKSALEHLERKLYVSHPDIILVISPHGSYFSDAFTINADTQYKTDLRAFGDLATRVQFAGEHTLSAAIRTAARKEQLPVTMISESNLDHSSSIPLYYLAAHLPKIKILPVGFCDLDWKTHVAFGNLLKEEIAKTNKRVAVIASGDLSHALMTESPAGYNPAGLEFDTKIQELLASQSLAGMLQMDPELVANAAECGFRSFLILMGILQGVHTTYRSYAYESPFGIGYLTANFVL